MSDTLIGVSGVACGRGLAQGGRIGGVLRRFGTLLTAFLPVTVPAQHNGAASAQEIDRYLDALEEPKRSTLALLRQRILDAIPEAEQGISYGVPAFKVRGKTIAGFTAFKNHLGYLPHSGSVFPQLKDYSTSPGALRFDIGHALPTPLVREADHGASSAGLPRVR
jgi:uncharacterized protein YdhG (YjbR/CyaY superfamily)